MGPVDPNSFSLSLSVFSSVSFYFPPQLSSFHLLGVNNLDKETFGV